MGRRVVETVDLRSTVRVVIAVSLALWAIALVTIVALYVLGLVSGGLGGAEGLVASFGFTGFRLSILPFLVGFVALAVAASVMLGALAAVIVLLYNALAPIIGGVELSSKDH
jgi:hypothetical protein